MNIQYRNSEIECFQHGRGKVYICIFSAACVSACQGHSRDCTDKVQIDRNLSLCARSSFTIHAAIISHHRKNTQLLRTSHLSELPWNIFIISENYRSHGNAHTHFHSLPTALSFPLSLTLFLTHTQGCSWLSHWSVWVLASSGFWLLSQPVSAHCHSLQPCHLTRDT